MAYTDQSSLATFVSTDFLINLTDDTGSGTINSTVVTYFADAASALVDSFIRKKYSTPVSTSVASTPLIIKDITNKIAVFSMVSRRQGFDLNIDTNFISFQYQEAIRELEDIRDGRIELTTSRTPRFTAVKAKEQLFGDEREDV